MAELTARTMQVDELFASAFLIEAPPYQRSFVWTADEALQLLEDVASLQKSAEDVRDRGEYFLGAMVFVEREEPTAEPPPSRLWKKKRARPSTSQRLDVVDGLQRLTTLTILFCVLRDLAEAGGERVSPLLLAAIRAGDGTSANNRLSLGEAQDRFFLDHVRSPGATLIAAATAGGTPAEKCM